METVVGLKYIKKEDFDNRAVPHFLVRNEVEEARVVAPGVQAEFFDIK